MKILSTKIVQCSGEPEPFAMFEHYQLKIVLNIKNTNFIFYSEPGRIFQIESLKTLIEKGI
jgi:hypothetical protein